MKSAYAALDSHTYTYPAPLGTRTEPIEPGGIAPSENPFSIWFKGHIDDEVMAEIKTAQKAGDSNPAPTLTLRMPRSKGDRDRISEFAQSIAFLDAADGEIRQVTEQRIASANRRIFGLLAEGWTGECFGNEKPTEDAFGRLDGWTAAWVMACLMDVQDRVRPDFQEAATSSSKRPRRGRDASPAASVSA